MSIFEVGERIEAGSFVVVAAKDGKLYHAGLQPCDGDVLVGEAVELLREGFRARLDGFEVREDDA